MKITVSWNNPKTYVGGGAFLPADLAYIDAQVRRVGGTFQSVAHVVGVSTTAIPGMSPGQYVLRLIAVDKKMPPDVSAPVDVPFTIPGAQKPAPSAVTLAKVAVT